jgi:hypothetical protein
VNPEASGLEGVINGGDLVKSLKGIDSGDGECTLRSLEFDAGLRNDVEDGDEIGAASGEELREAEDPRRRGCNCRGMSGIGEGVSFETEGVKPAEKLFDLGRDPGTPGVKFSLGMTAPDPGGGAGLGAVVGGIEEVGNEAEAVALRLI